MTPGVGRPDFSRDIGHEFISLLPAVVLCHLRLEPLGDSMTARLPADLDCAEEDVLTDD
jgi:hypothetical protein